MAAGHHQKSVRPRSHAYPRFRQTPTGVVQRFIVRVPKGSAALVLQTGLYSRYTKNMVLGLPGDIINGKIAQIKAAWRGAFSQADTCPTRARPAISKSYVRIMRPRWRWSPPRVVSASPPSRVSCAAPNV